MIPLKLEIEGLYSYQQKQIINFENLTDVGLFGIFGAVGSGKSSILEAISFVLYGQTERLNQTDKRGYNMLNLKSNKAIIDFEFLNYNNEKYRFVCVWERDSKKFDKVDSFDRKAYKLDGNAWIATDVLNVEKIVGLSYMNFKRTIIIPQGKFKEFLELKGTERSNMMMEIFHLHKFDLYDKASNLKDISKTKKATIEGNLMSYANVLPENLEKINKEIEDSEKELIIKIKDLEKLKTEVSSLTQLKDLAHEIEKQTKKLDLLKLEQEKMEFLEKEIQVFESLEKQFKTPLANFNTNKKDIDLLQLEKKQKLTEKLETDKLLTKLASELLILDEKIKTVPQDKDRITDLSTIIEIHRVKSELNGYENTIITVKNSLSEKIEIEKNYKTISTDLLKEIQSLKGSKIDTSVLIEIGNWYSLNESFKSKFTDLEKQSSLNREELLLKNDFFIKNNLNENTWREDLDKAKINLEKEKDVLEKEKSKLTIAKGLAHYAANLHDGENCPLCGSLEHPTKLEATDVNELLDEIDFKIKNFEKQFQEITTKNADALNNEKAIEKLKSEQLILVTSKQDLELENKKHLKLFIWKEFNKENRTVYDAKMLEIQQNEKIIQVKEKELDNLLIKQTQISEEIEKLKEDKAKFDLIIAKLEGEFSTLLSKLKILKWSDYENETSSNITFQKDKIETEIVQIENEFKDKNNQKLSFSNQLAGLIGSFDQLLAQESTLNKNLVQNKLTLEELVKINKFTSLDEVELILQKSLNTEELKKAVEDFKVNLQTTKNILSEAISKMENKEFNLEEFEIKSIELKQFQDYCENLKIEIATKKNNCEKIKIDLEKKNEILEEFTKENTRFENLKKLTTLFNSNGFVNYVSSIYLQSLAHAANDRFHRITKNKLSLIINSSNDFEVKDYLNDGYSRHIKTLSGGQAFQASLCLALALADSVQTFTNNNKNFFFIDEGFGTQDADSVSLVYDTLQSLMKENRIVGFISHLSELQEKIPKSITIINDDETGSAITYS